MNAAPAGFEPHSRKSPVTDAWEPIFARPAASGLQLGLRLDDAHCNARGFAHGGVIAALADNAMGLSYVGALKRDGGEGDLAGAVTLSLNLDYLASGLKGQWLQIEPRVLKAGASIGFVDALVTADGTAVARASATFKAVRGRA